VASLLGLDSSSLPAKVELTITDSLEAASNEVHSALRSRGLTQEQAAAWTRWPEFERDIALYWTLVKHGALHSYSAEFIDKLNRVEELKTVELLDPDGNSLSAEVGHGRMRNKTDVFVEYDTGEFKPW
jgi:hypothetical protein